jgi:D-aminopeptidase
MKLLEAISNIPLSNGKTHSEIVEAMKKGIQDEDLLLNYATWHYKVTKIKINYHRYAAILEPMWELFNKTVMYFKSDFIYDAIQIIDTVTINRQTYGEYRFYYYLRESGSYLLLEENPQINDMKPRKKYRIDIESDLGDVTLNITPIE